MRNLWSSLLIMAAVLSSCTAISSVVHDDKVVAKVGDYKLYESEVQKLIPPLSTPEDSAAIAARYINSWAMDKLYMDVAERQLSKSDLDVSDELEEYRRSLVKYRYEQNYINDRLDTLVTEAQVRKYYEANQADFELSRPILKVRFVDVMKDSPNKDDILRMMTSKEFDDLQMADTLAKSTALKYLDSSNTWVDAAVLSNEFGIDWQSMISKIQNNTIKVEPQDRGDLLFAYVCDMQKSGVAPLEYCEDRIRDIIISERKHQLLKSLEQDLLDNALESKKFVIYQ